MAYKTNDGNELRNKYEQVRTALEDAARNGTDLGKLESALLDFGFQRNHDFSYPVYERENDQGSDLLYGQGYQKKKEIFLCHFGNNNAVPGTSSYSVYGTFALLNILSNTSFEDFVKYQTGSEIIDITEDTDVDLFYDLDADDSDLELIEEGMVQE